MTNQQIKESLIKAGVKNLNDYGYPNVTIENIRSDQIYAAFFETMLKSNIGKSTSQVDNCINELLVELTSKPSGIGKPE